MSEHPGKITVYYDGACPRCVRDRERYEWLAGKEGESVCWFDITGQDQRLGELGIDPCQALTELHVRDENGRVLSELAAYILLMRRVPLLKPLAWALALPVIRPLMARLYHRTVLHRLRRSGRL